MRVGGHGAYKFGCKEESSRNTTRLKKSGLSLAAAGNQEPESVCLDRGREKALLINHHPTEGKLLYFPLFSSSYRYKYAQMHYGKNPFSMPKLSDGKERKKLPNWF